MAVRSRRIICREIYDKYLNRDLILSSSLSSLLVIAYTECFLKCLESGINACDDLEDLPTIFSSEVSRRINEYYRCDSSYVEKLLRHSRERLELIEKASRKLFKEFYMIRAELVSRMLIHTRSSTLPLEISLAWDPYLNIPYIPATSIKGALRSYFREYKIDINGCDEKTLFGTEEGEGVLEFFDAYPVSCRKYLVDAEVTTPHYRELEGKMDEASSNPTPIVHLAISPGTVFHIPITFRSTKNDRCRGVENKVIDHVMNAIENGIGARTSVGYGYIRVRRS
jgi:CRISPR-associated protein Cmr6